MCNDTDDEPCPYCGGATCDDTCTVAFLAEDDDAPDLGTCCICGALGSQVCVLIMLNAKSPLRNRGWGCLTCGLANHGALAVVCTRCAAPYERQERYDIEEALRWVCRGHPGTDGRLPIGELRGEHGHEARLHPERSVPFTCEPLETDTRFGSSAEKGQGCRCSRCGQTIWPGVVAVLAVPASGAWEYRYHPTCLGATPTDDDPYADDPDDDATPTQEDAPHAPRPPE